MVAEGRNVAMYRAPSIKHHLEDPEFHDFLTSVERSTSIWFSEKKQNLIGTATHIESQDGITDIFDLQTDNALYNIGGTRFDSSDLLRLAIGSSFIEDSIESVGIFIPLDGKLFTLKLPENIKTIASHILKIALSKN